MQKKGKEWVLVSAHSSTDSYLSFALQQISELYWSLQHCMYIYVYHSLTEGGEQILIFLAVYYQQTILFLSFFMLSVCVCVCVFFSGYAVKS